MPGLQNRIYIASKLNLMEREVNSLKTVLEERGYEFIYDWTANPVPKPFEQHQKQAHAAAEAMAEAVRCCDILILLCAPNGLGMYIEAGGAMVTGIILKFILKQDHKRIFVVGEENDRSVFYYHDSVTRLPSVPALLNHLPSLT